jgi:hypothetical protein
MKSIKIVLARIPWFYFLFSLYPLLFLWAYNKIQINATEVIRPLAISIIAAVLIFGILWIIFRSAFKAGLHGTLILILFYTYGRVYYWIRNISGDASASRHRILLVAYGIVFLAGTWLILKWWEKLKRIQTYLSITALVLVIIPVIQLGTFYLSMYLANRQLAVTSKATAVATGPKFPDVYFIVLDEYMRSDAMLKDLGYDNSSFINKLRKMGFYVANCSRPNYGSTEESLPTTLNLNYLPELKKLNPSISQKAFEGFYLQNNEVRMQLEKLGYITVAFRTDFPWTEIKNAGVYFDLDPSLNRTDYIHAFEDMYLKSTAGLALIDLNNQYHISQYLIEKNLTDFPYKGHVVTALSLLKQLPTVSTIPGPKFVFVHILIPHGPYVFAPDGSLLTDTGFYGGDLGAPINNQYQQKGYLNGVQFIDNRIAPVLNKIITTSSVAPIIVLEGDHGLSGSNRFTNLLAYYLPNGYKFLYPSITPVNSFRLIMDEYFGANYSLLPNISYDNKNTVVPETYPGCTH